ncbi:MAG: acyl-CoA dehydrogenase family protein [Dehalococcoidia bacterium]|nr:acyl-CoA dehydrogenase family protein [Dehalococcoidia bacterium]
MDFELHYTAEQEAFRREVKAWFAANFRPNENQKLPVDYNDITPEIWAYHHELRKHLGAKGWLAPLFPKEYGGGGLNMEEAVIIEEEIAHAELQNMGDLGIPLGAPSIMVWATEEQKKRFLPPILTAQDVTWQCFTEPDAGTDLASLKMKADRDGDDYILNGQKIFVGTYGDVDWLYTLAVTDQTKPRHANIGAFLVPAKTPGIDIQSMDIVGRGIKRVIYYDNVRVAKTQLIGGETDGWKVANSTLEVEHGGGASMHGHDDFFKKLSNYCRVAKRNGKPLSKDADVRDSLVELWMNAQISRLFEMRNYYMRASKTPWRWEGSQNALHRKLSMPRIAHLALDILGPVALTADPKLRALAGEVEAQQRQSLLTHPGGTPEAQKIIIARRIGIAKTQQRAAAIH